VNLGGGGNSITLGGGGGALTSSMILVSMGALITCMTLCPSPFISAHNSTMWKATATPMPAVDMVALFSGWTKLIG